MDVKQYLDEALEELSGAKKYIKCALRLKMTDPAKAQKYYDMAQEEVKHAHTIYSMTDGMTVETPLEHAYVDAQRDWYAEKHAAVRAMIDSFR